MMLGTTISICLFVSTLMGYSFAQAPPEDIGGDTIGLQPRPSEPANVTASPSEIASANSTCQSGNANRISVSNNDSGDFGNNTYDTRFTLNGMLIWKDLSSLSPSDIKDFRGLNKLPTQEIKLVLCSLTSGNLSKVLMNIPFLELQGIKGKLNPPTFEDILSSLSEDNRNRILNRTES